MHIYSYDDEIMKCGHASEYDHIVIYQPQYMSIKRMLHIFPYTVAQIVFSYILLRPNEVTSNVMTRYFE